MYNTDDNDDDYDDVVFFLFFEQPSQDANTLNVVRIFLAPMPNSLLPNGMHQIQIKEKQQPTCTISEKKILPSIHPSIHPSVNFFFTYGAATRKAQAMSTIHY